MLEIKGQATTYVPYRERYISIYQATIHVPYRERYISIYKATTHVPYRERYISIYKATIILSCIDGMCVPSYIMCK